MVYGALDDLVTEAALPQKVVQFAAKGIIICVDKRSCFFCCRLPSAGFLVYLLNYGRYGINSDPFGSKLALQHGSTAWAEGFPVFFPELGEGQIIQQSLPIEMKKRMFHRSGIKSLSLQVCSYLLLASGAIAQVPEGSIKTRLVVVAQSLSHSEDEVDLSTVLMGMAADNTFDLIWFSISWAIS